MSFGGGGSSQPPPPPVAATVVPMRQLTEVTSAATPKSRTFMDAGAAATFMGAGAPVQDPTKPFGSTLLGGG